MLFFVFFLHLQCDGKVLFHQALVFCLFQSNSNLSSYIPFQNYERGERERGGKEVEEGKRREGGGNFLNHIH